MSTSRLARSRAGKTKSATPLEMALRGIEEYSASFGSCTRMVPPASLTARTPMAPSEPAPLRTTAKPSPSPDTALNQGLPALSVTFLLPRSSSLTHGWGWGTTPCKVAELIARGLALCGPSLFRLQWQTFEHPNITFLRSRLECSDVRLLGQETRKASPKCGALRHVPLSTQRTGRTGLAHFSILETKIRR
jgi:hypothetical protein